MSDEKPPLLSVVIPTRGRATLLKRCLEALAAQEGMEPGSYEVIVADDGAEEASALDTRRVVRDLASSHDGKFRYVAVSGRHGPAAARNSGWHSARGRIIAFTDDDTIPSPRWLAAGSRVFSDPQTVAVTGMTHVPLPKEPTDYELNESGLERAEFITANCFCRRSALETVGGFDESFTMAWREDSDLHFRLLTIGEIRREPLARVVHPVRPAPWGVALKQAKKACFNALLYKKHPKLYRARIQPRPPVRYYLMLLALVAAVIAAWAGYPRSALLGVASWAALVTEFAIHRLRRTRRDPKHVAEMFLTSALLAPIVIYWRLYGAMKFRVVFL